MDNFSNTMGVGYEPNQMSTQAGFAAQQPASGFGQNAFNQGIGSLPPAGGAISPTMNTQAVGALGTMLGGMVQPSVGGQVQGPYGSGMQFPINSTNSTTTADMMRGGTGAPFGQVVGQLGMNQPGMGAKPSGPMMTPEQVANMPGPSLAHIYTAEDAARDAQMEAARATLGPMQAFQFGDVAGRQQYLQSLSPEQQQAYQFLQQNQPKPLVDPPMGNPGFQGGTMLGQQQEQLVKGLPSQEQMAAMQQLQQQIEPNPLAGMTQQQLQQHYGLFPAAQPAGQPGMGDALISKAMAYPSSTMRPAVQPPVIDRGGRARTPSYAPRAVPANVPERGYFGDGRFDGRGVGGSSGSNIRPTSSMRDMRERGEDRAREMRSDMTDRRYGGGQQSRMDYFQNRLNELGGGNLKNLFGPASGGLASLFGRRRG